MIEEIHYFHDKIVPFEKSIIDFYATINYMYGRPKNLATIFGYFLIHKRLNQTVLAQLTGYSRGTISILLSKLQDIGAIEISNIQHKVKEYIFNVNYIPFVLTKKDPRVIEKTHMKEFFKEYLSKGSKLKDSFERAHFLKRIQDIQFIYIYYFDYLYKEDKNWNFETVNQAPLEEVYNFSEDFKLLESSFIEYLIEIDYFQESDEKMTWLNCYFLTRECLSLPELQKLTSFDKRTIKKRLDKLVEDRYVAYYPQKKYYRMHSLTHSFGSMEGKVLEFLRNSKKKFKGFLEEFNLPTSPYCIYHGYHHILVQLQHVIDKIDVFISHYEEDPLILYKNPTYKSKPL
ncbi:hypothetical protein NEF87_000509 [Candidatus Lokiarchaeum ossiferum]|uniref:MarR family transcriptional regulator n=1 Tax=Candidatus Lokiarchaeum ossiferum TaxID=2951803 RepID=A0ABY6HNT6_9ARCH|nr:hypothetical protein NEF87_000509 [Candidatus Lokiarchaeum sp. B-35]